MAERTTPKALDIAERINQIQRQLEHDMPIRLVGNFSQFPADVQMDAREKGIPGTAVKAVYAQGEIFVNQASVKSLEDLERCVHEELYAHYGFHQLYGLDNRARMEQLYTEMGGDAGVDALCAQYDIDLSPYHAALVNEPKATRESIVAEELLAHLAVHPQMAVKSARRNLMGGLRHWWRENGFIGLSRFNSADVAHLLHRANKAAHHGPAQKISTLSEVIERLSSDGRFDPSLAASDHLISAYVLLAQHDTAFRLPKVDSKALGEIVDEALGLNTDTLGGSAVASVPGATEGWTVTTAGGQSVSIFRDANSVWMREPQTLTPADNQQLFHVMANFAHSNGIKVALDPNAFDDPSPQTLNARLDNMITSALRFNTTDHLAPHRLHLEGAPGTPALDWVAGDDVHNVRDMLIASYVAADHRMPFISELHYNRESTQFENRQFDFHYDRDRVSEMTRACLQGTGHEGQSVPNELDSRLLAERAILAGTIIQQSDEENVALLAHLGEQCAQRLNGILYSLSTEAEDWGQAPLNNAQTAAALPQATLAPRADEAEQVPAPERDASTAALVYALHTTADELEQRAQTIIDTRFNRDRKTVFPAPAQERIEHPFGYTPEISDEATERRNQARALRLIADTSTNEQLHKLRSELEAASEGPLFEPPEFDSTFGGDFSPEVPDEQEQRSQAYALALSAASGQHLSAYASLDETGARLLEVLNEAEEADLQHEAGASVQAVGTASLTENLSERVEQLSRALVQSRSQSGDRYEHLSQEAAALVQAIDAELSGLSASETREMVQNLAVATAYHERFVLNAAPVSLSANADDAQVIEAMADRLFDEHGALDDDTVIRIAKETYEQELVQRAVLRNHLSGFAEQSEQPQRKFLPTSERPQPAQWINDALHPVQGSLFQFAGSNALTANHLALAAAQQFSEQGHNAEAIRRKTGWHRGEDNQWRFEISDQGARFRSDFLVEKEIGIALFEGRLGDVMDHPKLFAAYPGIADSQLKLAMSEGSLPSGSAHPPAEHPYSTITVTADSTEAAMGVLLHEVQHIIQDGEDFARGTNPKSVEYRATVALQHRADELRERQQGLSAETNPSQVTLAEQQVITKELGQIDTLLAQIKAGQWAGRFHQMYEDTAGEREAEEARIRKDMSEQQRVDTAPGNTTRAGRVPIVIRAHHTLMDTAASFDFSPVASMTLLPQRSVMKLTQAATRSSFNHEAGHLFLDMEAKTSRHRPLDALQQKVAEFLDVNDLQGLTRESQETFAHAFEQYMDEKNEAAQNKQPLSGVFAVTKAWLQNVCARTDDHSETLSPAARAMFDELLSTYTPPHQDNLNLAEQNEYRLALELEATGIYGAEQAREQAGLISAYALAKAERDPNYPSVDHVFDHMNLSIEAATAQQMREDLHFDWDSFDLDALVRKQQAVSRAEAQMPGPSLNDHDLSGEVRRREHYQEHEQHTQSPALAH